MSAAGGAGGKIVGLRDLRGVEGSAGSVRARGVLRLFADAEMRLGLRAIVEAEDAFDDAAERGGDLDSAAAHAAGAARVLIVVEFDVECAAEIADRAAEKNGAARAADFYYLQFILRGEGADFLYVGGARAVADGELRAGKMFALRGREFADFCDVGKLFGRPAAAEEDRDLDLFLWVACSDFARAG